LADGLVLAVLAVALVTFAVLLRDAYRSWAPARLLLASRYVEARRAGERLEKSWMRIFRSVRAAARIVIASALHMEGKHDASLAEIAKLAPNDRERLDRTSRYAIASIEAANLVLSGRDLERAAKLLEEIRDVYEPPEDILLYAHVKHGLGDTTEATKLLERAGAKRKGGRMLLGRVVLLENAKQREAIFHTLRGLLLIKLGRSEEAMKDLTQAAAIPTPGWYSDRARALLPPKGGDFDPRSSLAPTVTDE
jgi:tetratricopeptide (TPR) repeat protein